MCAATEDDSEQEATILTELARERDLQKYYQPWLDSNPMAEVPLNAADRKIPSVQVSRDTTLTALAQLAALRLNVKRAMVSLIQKDTQIILAEATQSLSLVDESRHDAGDHIWLGQVAVPRQDCMDEHVFGAEWIGQDCKGNEHVLPALVISDVRQDDRFNKRPYVLSEPGVQFYAGVPITTKKGYQIGVYGVSDPRPRPDGLSLDQIRFMQDVARIIADHLERVKTSIDSERDEVFVRGMHKFIEGASGLRQEQEDHPPEQFRASPQEHKDDIQGTDPQENQTPPEQSDHDQDTGNASEEHATEQPMRGMLKTRQSSEGDVPRYSSETTTAKESSDTTTDNVKQIYQRAATSLRGILDAQGCVILDASSGFFANNADGKEFQSVIGRTMGDFDTDVEDETGEELNRNAVPLGASFSDDAPVRIRNAFLKRKHLKTCLNRYPDGQFFHLDNGKTILPQQMNDDQKAERQFQHSTSTDQRHQHIHLPRQILQQLSDARWLVFLPLYNRASRQWAAGLLVWSDRDNVRDLDQAMSYFRTFGSCLITEVTSTEATNTSAAKSTFIASISHDLRSPLHGMLGSLEFLEDTMTTAYQTSLIGSIETCGRTLLDTIDHLLDFAKINNMSHGSSENAKGDIAKSVADKKHQETAAFDLGLLLEEVVEAVFAGQTFRKTRLRGQDAVDDATEKIQNLNMDNSRSTEEQIHAGSAKFSGRVFFILDVRKSKSWCMKGQTGGLRRVIMNIVGNAIKYCSQGTIEIVLSIEEKSTTTVDVEINVKDTGIGISQNYLENHLFKAFSQEDPFTAGAGLGLSIASQIIQSMDGKIRIESEKNVGTHATISLPMQLADPGTCNPDDIMQAAEKAASGKQICLLNPYLDEDRAINGQLSKLTASITRTCEVWFGMKIFQASKVEDGHSASIYVYCEPPPIEYLLEHHTERKVSGKTGKEAALLIICTNAFEAAALRAAGITQLIHLGRIVEVISQPVGGRKLARTVLQSLQRIEGATEDPKMAPRLPLTQVFGSKETLQRAADIDWKTSTTVYDHELARHRPSVNPYQWRSEAFPSKVTNGDLDAGPVEYGEIKAGRPPEKSPAAAANIDPAGLPNVLLVDDNGINLKLLVTFMKKIKLPYAEAVNGLEAFNKFKAADKPFDFVLMDLQMPIMDGLESTRKIREYERETKVSKQSNIIAITGVGNEATRKEAADAGMTQYLTKPVKFKALQQMLEKEIKS